MMRPFVLLCVLAGSALSPGAAAAGTGLTGSYFNNRTFSGSAVTRTDEVIDFAWPGAPGPVGIGADNFSARWEGQVEALLTGIHTFFVATHDGAMLWVDDQLIVGRTLPASAAGEMAGSIRLEAGRRYNLRLEFIAGTGEAAVRLAWSGASLPRQVIPAARLFPASEAPERGTIMLEHWAGVAGASLGALTTLPTYPDKPSGRESLIRFECLAPNVGDNYGQRVAGFLVPALTGSYTFAVAASDVAELWLSPDANPAGKVRMVDVPAATAIREYTRTSAPVSLEQGRKYYVELLHLAGTGLDHFSVAWRRPGAAAFEVIGADSLVPLGLNRAPPGQGNYLATLATGHPRVFITAQKIEWLRQELAAKSDARLTSWYQTLKASADTIRNQPVNTYVKDDRGTILSIARSVYDRTYKLALAYLMTGDTGYAERLYLELEKAANPANGRAPGDFPDWDPAHFLDVAELSHAFAIGFDWLYGYWTPARRDILRQAIATRGLTPGMSQYNSNAGWTQPTNNNWNLVCTGGLTMGALAIAGENSADTTLVEQILHQSVTKVAPVMAHYTADNGGWYEGPGYWDFATEYNCRMLAALESVLGSDFGLSATRGLALTGYYPPYMVGPTRLSFNFADAGSGNMSGCQLFWLARRFNKPEYAWYQRTNSGGEVLNLFWYDARGNDPVVDGFPLDNWFRGATGATRFNVQDIVTLRSQWLEPRATFVAAKAGEVGASHGNLDAGTFVLDAHGQRWATELGGDDYGLPGYFSEPQRWTYYRLRAEGQNTLVINPGAGVDQVLRSKPPVVLFATEPNAERGATVMDLTSAYVGATRVQRGLALGNRRRHVLIQDEIEYATPATVWWFMHYGTDKTVELAADGTSATMSKGVERLWLKIVAGGGTFQIMDAGPLPSSPKPAGQNANPTFKKLAIYLPSVSQTTLAVYAVPLVAGENPPSALPVPTPLASWPMTGDAPPRHVWTAAVDAVAQAWSSSGNWSSAPAADGSPNGTLDFFSGVTLPAGQFTAQNDLTGNVSVNTLVLGGTSSGVARVQISGRALTLGASGAVAPVVYLNATAGAGLSYEIAAPLTLAATTTFLGGGTAAFRLSGVLSGPAGFIQNSSTPLILTGANTHAGPTVIAASTLQVGDGGATGSLGTGPIVNHGTLRFNRTGTLAVPNDISGPGGLTIDCPINAGTIELSGRNSFTGGVTISAGALRLTNSSALGAGPKTIILNSGTAGNPQLRLDGGAGGIALPASLAFTTSNNNGAIFNEAGRNVISGPFTLSSGGGNTKIVVAAGTLTLNGNLAPNTTSRNLDLSGAGTGIVNGNITDGTGANVLGVIMTGTGTWTLNGDNRWSGPTSVNAGTLLVHGRLAGAGAVNVARGATLGGTGAIAGPVTVASGGRLAPGASPGTLTLNGTLVLAAGSTVGMELNAQTLAHDAVEGMSRVTYGGTLAVTNLAGAFAAGQSFPLFRASQASGSFSSITPSPGPGLVWDFNPATGRLQVLAASTAVADSRIANLSILTSLAAADPLVIVGTVIGGAGASGGKPLLVRAVGPSLAPFDVPDVLSDPRLELYSGSVVIAANDNWGGAEVLRGAFAQAGAFAFQSVEARDAAVRAEALPSGGYTVHVTGVGGTAGAVLIELYDGTPAEAFGPTSPRLLNVSVRKSIPPGGLLTAGFVIVGPALKQVLIRAVGPALAAPPFNLAGTMADPKVELFRGSVMAVANDNWGGGTDLATAFARTGAFALPAGGKDAALLVNLAPGAYTAQVSGVGGAAGEVIVEVYEVPVQAGTR